ncbi:hypothetical protein EU523_00705 [Candidatus Heimdallarchaeota archaeon]|nr:MAG: hypothetical protein EU523_00705 [Candidatus Heimdallarchaeota archaeon]
MEPWILLLIIFGAIILAIIIIIIKRNKKGSKKRTTKSSIKTYLDYHDYLSAGRLYLERGERKEAADLYFRIPPEKKPPYERMVIQILGEKGARLFWIHAGRRYADNNLGQAKTAFLLGQAYFDAIKLLIDKGMNAEAIAIVNQIPVSYQEGAVRRLSQYAFNRGKYQIAADLLRAIGLVDEADAVSAVAAHEYGSIERPEIAADFYDSAGRQDLAGRAQEEEGDKALAESRIATAKKAYQKAVQAYDDANQPKEALRVEQLLEQFYLLDEFREFAVNGEPEKAEALIDDIRETFPVITLSALYAEIGSVLEQNNYPHLAITYFDKAADSTNNPVKRQSYVNALRRLGSEISKQPSIGQYLAPHNLEEPCIVCRKPIKKGQEIAHCPHCKKPAHYSHLIEWIKVQGSCPNCYHKLRVDDIQNN